MTNERKAQIEQFAKEMGMSFASAKTMLEEIENDIDTHETMQGIWY